MSRFSLDEMVRMAESSRWYQDVVASDYLLAEEVYWGKLRLELGHSIWLQVARYKEDAQETCRLTVGNFKNLVDVVYGDDAAKVMEIARQRAARFSKYLTRKEIEHGKDDLELLRKDRKRYER